MAIDLGTFPRQTEYSLSLVTKTNVIDPLFGGPQKRLARMGSKWRLSVSIPAIAMEACGRALINRLQRGDTGLVEIPIPDHAREWPPYGGSVLVNGGSQAGTSLVVDGGREGWLVKEGDFLSVTTAGKRYLYQATADTRFNASGQATISIWPMLRVSPADNDAVALKDVVMEGYIDEPPAASIDRFGAVGLSFSVTEAA